MITEITRGIAFLSFFGAAALLVRGANKKAVLVEDKKTQESATGSMGVMGLIESNSVLDFLLNDGKNIGDKVALRYFNESEFGGWFDKMSPELLKKLDEFRHQWGFPVQVSPHHDAVGREHPTSTSQHNIMKWGEVRAIDIFPKNSTGAYINTVAERKRAYDIARSVGFTGIGLYTDTVPGHMVHLDVRKGNLAKWSRIAGQYKGINEALV